MALVHSRIGRVFYGSSHSGGALGSSYKVHCQSGFNHHYLVFKGCLEEETDKLLNDSWCFLKNGFRSACCFSLNMVSINELRVSKNSFSECEICIGTKKKHFLKTFLAEKVKEINLHLAWGKRNISHRLLLGKWNAIFNILACAQISVVSGDMIHVLGTHVSTFFWKPKWLLLPDGSDAFYTWIGSRINPLSSLWNIRPQQLPSTKLGSGRSSSALPMWCWWLLSRHCCFGRPTLGFPWGFHSRACLVMLDTGFLRVWPIQPHLRFLISILMGVGFTLFHSSSFETTSGHLMLRMFFRHLLVNVCNLWMLVLVTCHVSEPYSRTDFTLVLKIRILFWTDRAVDLQICLMVLKAYLALLIQHLMSSSVPPSLLTTLPR